MKTEGGGGGGGIFRPCPRGQRARGHYWLGLTSASPRESVSSAPEEAQEGVGVSGATGDKLGITEVLRTPLAGWQGPPAADVGRAPGSRAGDLCPNDTHPERYRGCLRPAPHIHSTEKTVGRVGTLVKYLEFADRVVQSKRLSALSRCRTGSVPPGKEGPEVSCEPCCPSPRALTAWGHLVLGSGCLFCVLGEASWDGARPCHCPHGTVPEGCSHAHHTGR